MTEQTERFWTRKKYWLIGGLAALMIFSGVALAVGSGVGPLSRHSPEYVLAKMDEHAAELNLTAEQQAAYRELRAKAVERMTQGRERHLQVFEDLKNEINKDTPDLTALAGRMKTRMTEMTGRMGQGLDMFIEFYNILDDSQKALVIEDLRGCLEKAQRFQAMRGGA